ncbi:MAG: trimeric intracellular cation channel family protein, partial [Halolamina sp.]
MVGAGLAFAAMNAVGLVAFAAAGALKGRAAGLDLFGIVVLGFLTALGGGTIRDLLVGRVPTSLQSDVEVLFALLGILIAVAVSVVLPDDPREAPALLFSDAVGLAAFAATGAAVGIETGLTLFGTIVVATLTGVGGGSLSDLLLVRVPAVLREDFYATPAVVGGVVAWL